ncbi:efflux transporter outer membrane subunit [Gynuella sunshinyii]|uniref:Outer membrane protein n=1 Tax=Gynuella sunshinyii YC6258 TaxID=1445510 RepID=A0A0C5VLE6_9GAMM|nr:efflux transporter outer membrane subunit [Gynuella sunshinyii]AJQ94163.1 outer membrane protein [Gynuella sunshinyii YC6258]
MRKQYLALYVALLLVSGCVSLPDEEPSHTSMVDKLQYEKSVTIDTDSLWPADQWWQRYHDDQLDQLIARALESAPNLQIAAARINLALASVQQSGAAMMPTISANASATQTRLSYHNGNDFVPRGWNTFGSATLNFDYELDLFGKNRAQIAAATSEMFASQAEQAQARLVLTASITKAYAELARLYANLANLSEARDIRLKTVQLTRKRYDEGLENRGSVRSAEAALALTESSLLELQQQILIQKHALSALAGAGPDEGEALTEPALTLDASHGIPSDAGINLIGRRPDISVSRLQAEAAAHRIGVAKSRFYPNVSLTGYIGSQAMGLENLNLGGSLAGGVGPAIYLPIFQGGAIKAGYKAAGAQYDSAVATYNQAVNRAFQQLADVSTQQKFMQQRIKKMQQAEAAAADAYQIVNQRYEGGLTGYLEVLNAQDNWLSSKRSLVNLQSEAVFVDVETVLVLGGGFIAEHS